MCTLPLIRHLTSASHQFRKQNDSFLLYSLYSIRLRTCLVMLWVNNRLYCNQWIRFCIRNIIQSLLLVDCCSKVRVHLVSNQDRSESFNFLAGNLNCIFDQLFIFWFLSRYLHCLLFTVRQPWYRIERVASLPHISLLFSFFQPIIAWDISLIDFQKKYILERD